MATESINDRVDRIEKSDPSPLTTQQIFREIASLKELVETRFVAHETAVKLLQEVVNKNPTVNEVYVEHNERLKALGVARDLTREVLETRFDGMDKAIKLLQDTADKFPARIDEKIVALEKVHGERFDGVDKQFNERDIRSENDKFAATKAVDAALQAQKESAANSAESFKESNNKTEERFTKQQDQQSELLRTEVKGLQQQVNELKDRFNRGEGKGEGTDKNKSDTRLTLGVLITIAALVVGIAGVVVASILK